jgi:hypothetical protein
MINRSDRQEHKGNLWHRVLPGQLSPDGPYSIAVCVVAFERRQLRADGHALFTVKIENGGSEKPMVWKVTGPRWLIGSPFSSAISQFGEFHDGVI